MKSFAAVDATIAVLNAFQSAATQPATQAADESSPKKPSGYVNTVLQPYDGTDCFETWLVRFECVADYMEWTECDKLFHLKFNLTGNAGHILWNMGNKTTVEAAIRLLRNRFGTAGQSERYRAELCARHRKPGEDLQHLYQDIARLILLAYPDRSDDVTDLVARDVVCPMHCIGKDSRIVLAIFRDVRCPMSDVRQVGVVTTHWEEN